MTAQFAILLLIVGAVRHTDATEIMQADVCVYGATPAGIVAAIAAKQEGASVVLIEPSRWVGGILGAGIKPMQDCPEPRAVGGLTKAKVPSGNWYAICTGLGIMQMNCESYSG
jgi:NADPH-dependent 2,4-dienoyl-CoA reductase/sulfur reductase-like enzyme